MTSCMTALNPIDLLCPVCAMRFQSQAVVSTDSLGGRHTDFHERASGMQPLPYLVHMCDRCGYAGSEQDFDEDAPVSHSLKCRVWRELSPMVAPDGRTPGSDKYDAAAKVALWQAGEARVIADYYLRAAWCCVDEGDVEAERYYRRKAAMTFAEALVSYDGVDRSDRAVLTYLVGELWRRVGDVDRARVWFDAVAREVAESPGASPSWVLDAARQQRESPREWFA
jgi:uncharacterized protein (DUF2225 family)